MAVGVFMLEKMCSVHFLPAPTVFVPASVIGPDSVSPEWLCSVGTFSQTQVVVAGVFFLPECLLLSGDSAGDCP